MGVNMTAVSKEHIARDVYRAIYTLISQNVTDLQNPARPASQWIFAAWPENLGADKDDYPIIVIEKPEFKTEKWTLTKHNVSISVDITVFNAGNKAAEGADNLCDEIANIILNNKYSDLRNDKRLYNTQITRIDSDTVIHRGIKVHIKSMTVEFDYKVS